MPMEFSVSIGAAVLFLLNLDGAYMIMCLLHHLSLLFFLFSPDSIFLGHVHSEE